MDLSQRKFGLKLTPRDERDYPVVKLLPVKTSEEFPEEFIWPDLPPLGRQLNYDMCAAFAYTFRRRYVEKLQTGRDIPFSEAFTYANRVTGDDYEGEGMYMGTVHKNGKNRGVCPKDKFPQLGTYPELRKYFLENFTDLILAAAPYKTTAYARALSENEIKTAIMNPRVCFVTITIPIYSSFAQITKDNPIAPIPQPGEKLHGYHAVDIVGWTVKNGKKVYKVANWWDDEDEDGNVIPWGEDGYFYITEDFPVLEYWVEIDAVLPNYAPKKKVNEKLLTENRSYEFLAPRGFTVHSTATPGATLGRDVLSKAKNEFDYFNSGYRGGSSHYFVDWNEILRTIPEGEKAWHAGSTANKLFLSAELCEPRDNDPDRFRKFGIVWDNAVWLVADACYRYGWKPTELVKPDGKPEIPTVNSHNQVSGTWKETDHTDPIGFFKKYGKTWNDFIADVTKELNSLKGTEGNEVLDNLVIYADGDTGTALILSQNLGCPMVHKKDADKYQAKNKHWIGVQGTNGNGNYFYFGADRKDTAKKALL